MDKEIRLTNFSTCGGWAGKASIEVLDRVLGQINKSFSSDKILVDQKTKDDAAVYKITDDKAIIFTTDFFAPVVDDAFLFGNETSGLPSEILNSFTAKNKLRIPMKKQNRSLNLSNAASIVLYEAWRQNNFKFAEISFNG